jgi:hypothetical protein
MSRLTLSFSSVFDLHDFKKEAKVSNSEAIVNRLTGYFTPQEIELAKTMYNAEVMELAVNYTKVDIA